MSVESFIANTKEILVALALLFYYIGESIVLLVVPRSFRYKSVEGDIALVTGGGSGIGRLIALRLSKKGCIIVTWDINETANNETVEIIKKSGRRAHGYVCDLSSKDAIYETADRVKDEVGVVTILVNNAGIVTGKTFLESPDHMIQKTFDVNALAHFWTCKAFLPGMLDIGKGHIVNVASMAGLSGVNKLVDYCSSKFAAVGFDEALRMELLSEGHMDIHTTVICPYYINTGMFDGVQSKIFPILDQDYVADETVSAILTNEEMVILPKYGTLLFVLKSLVPTKAYFPMNRALGVCCSMDEFIGRYKRD